MGAPRQSVLPERGKRRSKTMSNRTLTDEQRRDIVRYRLENARKMMAEVESHRENGFYNTAVNRM